MVEKWLTFDSGEIALVLVSSVITYLAILLFTRLAGLRSFSKMSAADFAMTVAVGSLFASTISSPKPSLVIGLVALASLYTGQWSLAYLRRQSDRVSKLVDNEPILLMHEGKLLADNLARANVTKADVYGKLREANALTFDEVLAVVFETTGDISVLHSRDADAKLEPELLKDVIGAERISERRMVAT